MMSNYSLQEYEKWATIDKSYQQVNAMTGLYQCYCRFEFSSILEPLKNKDYNVCISYTYLDFGGGIFVTMPLGMCIGMLNNIGAALVIRYVKDIRFNSAQKQRQATFVAIFLMSYINSGLFISWTPDISAQLAGVVVAENLTASWYQIFGIMIFSSTLTTNLTPYIALLFDFVSSRLFKKRARSQLYFSIERKYAQLL